MTAHRFQMRLRGRLWIVMGMLFHRLLILLNEADLDSTDYHIARVMLQQFENLSQYSIQELADRCAVSKSTISKFIRSIGYEDYADFRDAAVFQDNKYHNTFNFVTNVMDYIQSSSLDTYLLTVQQDIGATYQSMDWAAIDRLVRDLVRYQRVGAFGLMFSETAALDLQIKLAYNQKFIVTNLNDLKQERFIQQAGEDTLIIVFSDSGEFLDKYQRIDEFSNKYAFSRTHAKVVVITSNPKVEQDPRVAYCVRYQKTRSLCTHRIVYGVLTDIIAYKYREYVQNLRNIQPSKELEPES